MKITVPPSLISFSTIADNDDKHYLRAMDFLSENAKEILKPRPKWANIREFLLEIDKSLYLDIKKYKWNIDINDDRTRFVLIVEIDDVDQELLLKLKYG